jgi:hypothetical protein
MLPPLHLFIKQEARQAANRLLGNGCSYVPNFGHSEVLIKMTDRMPLWLAPRDKFVTLNIFGRKFSVDFPTRVDWSTECVELVAPDGLVFFTDENVAEKAQSRLDKILTEPAWIQIEDFGRTHNWTLSIK